MKLTAEKTMTSFDLFKLVNQIREDAGQNKIRVNDFVARIRDELEGDNYETFVVKNPNNTETTAFKLTLDQCMLIGMRESKSVRRSVLARLKELEVKQLQPALPANYIEALESLVQSEKEKAVAIEQLQIAAPKIDYHDRVLATTNGITTTEIASELGISAIKLNRTLKDMRIQRKVGNRWVLTAPNLDQGLTVEVTHIDGDGESRHSMKWSEKGRKFIHELMKGGE